jgi:endoglucanase
VVLAVVGVVVVTAVRHVRAGPFEDPQGIDQLERHPQLNGDDPGLVAASKQAAADGDSERSQVLQRIDSVPTGLWLTPERYPTPADVRAYVVSVVAQADADGTVPVFVVYGIPGRDCSGQLSAGGLSADAYQPWVEAIADSVARADQSVVVLEPDALPSAIECGVVDQRVQQMAAAVDALRDAGVTTYVDAGHSDWVSAADMAPLLERVGVESVRGFTTNVSNYQPTSAETAYAEELSGLLGGAHYLVDTGRNGAGAGAVTDWCNPPEQALGQEPGYVDDGTALDAYVWIKPVGESDGTCNGGPAAGQLWVQRAVDLAEAAGW